MSTMFPYTITTKGINVFCDGVPRSFSRTAPNYQELIDAIDAGNVEAVRDIVDLKKITTIRSKGRVQIMDDYITLDGKQVTGRLIDRIIEMSRRGSKAIDGYVKFLEKLYNNPSKTAVDELYLFIEACNLPINSDGNFLAYKRVDENYMDIHTRTIRNMIGDAPSMARFEVDDNRNNVCSQGLHFCSYDYLPHYGANVGNKVMVVEIDPANVVAIPSDYNNAKGRTWTYAVVGEIENWVDDRITPFFTDEYDTSDEDSTDTTTDTYSDDSDNSDCEHCNDCGCHGDPDYEAGWNDDTDTSTVSSGDTATITVSNSKPLKNGRKLTSEQVVGIKYAIDWDLATYTSIGKQYGVSRKTIARIANRESYLD